MKKSNPYWYKLIKMLKNEGKIKTGPTIPYIFGAYKVLDSPFLNIAELLKSVQDTVIDKYPIIQKCPDIGKHVLMVQNKAFCNRYFKNFVRLNNKRNDNHILISSNTNLGKTLERVCFNLENLYFDQINNEKYNWSKLKDDWVRFDEEEEKLIMKIKRE